MTSLRGSRAKKAVCSHWTHTIKPLLVGLPEGRRTKSLKYDRLWCRGGDLMDIPHTRVQKSFGQTGRKVKIGRGHRKGLRDCRILRRCSMSPNPQLCQRGAMRQRMGEGNTPGGVSPRSQGARLRLATGTPRRRPPLSSGPTSVWRQPSLSAVLRGRQRAAQSF